MPVARELAERLGRHRQPFERGLEVAHDRRVLGVPEVETVGERPRPPARARHVACRLGHGVARAELGIAPAPERVPPQAEREPERALRVEAHDRGVGLPGPEPGAPLHLAVVVAVEVLARAQVEAAEQADQGFARRRVVAARLGRPGGRAAARGPRDPTAGRDRVRGAVDQDLAVPGHAIAPLLEHAPDDRGPGPRVDAGQPELAVVELAQLRGERLRDHPAVALLGLGAQQHLGGDRPRHAVEGRELDRAAAPARGRELGGGARHAPGAQVLEAGRDPPLAHAPEGLGVRDVEHPLQERVRKLDRAALVAAQLARGEGRAAEAAFVGGFPDQHEHPGALALGHPAPQHAVARRHAHRHDVDQAVLVEGAVEVEIAAQIRDPERVAVVGDALNHAAHHVAGVRRAPRVAEAQRVEHADHLGPHAPHVAHDAPDAGRRPFDRQHLARVVVALVGEHQDQVVARGGERHDTRVLARPDPNLGRRGREAAEQVTGGLVGAVLAPQDAEQHGFGPRGRAAEQLEQQRHLVRREGHAAPVQRRGDRLGVAGLLGGEGRPQRRRVPGHPGPVGGGETHGRGRSARANSASTCRSAGSRVKHPLRASGESAAVTRRSDSSDARNGSPRSRAASACSWTIR